MVAVMAAICLLGLVGTQIAPLAVGLGLVMFFLKRSRDCVNLRGARHQLRRTGNVLLVAAPVALGIAALLLAKLALPGYITHLRGRMGVFSVFLVGEMVLMAMAEEFAWRAYFQRVLLTRLHRQVAPAILLTAAAATLGSFAPGEPVVVACDLFVVLLGNVLYGLIFHRTNNAVLSAGAHLLASAVTMGLLWVL